MKAYLVRHGQTTWNEESLCQGSTDTPLTDLGLKQAEAAALLFEEGSVSHVIVSGLQRSRHTGEILADKLGLDIQQDPRINEMDFGDMEGVPLGKMEDRFSSFYETWEREPFTTPMPNGESFEDLWDRVNPAWESIRSLRGNVAIAGHCFPHKLILCWALGLDMARQSHIHLDVASISMIELRAGSPFGFRKARLEERFPVVASINQTYHLDDVR